MARYYDSGMARFCSADPVFGWQEDPQTWNRYAYARNDPVNKNDPSGKFFEFLFSFLTELLSSLFGSLGIDSLSLGALGQASVDLPYTITVTATPIGVSTTGAAITGGMLRKYSVRPILGPASLPKLRSCVPNAARGMLRCHEN